MATFLLSIKTKPKITATGNAKKDFEEM